MGSVCQCGAMMALIVIGISLAAIGADGPRAAVVDNVVDDYFGVKVNDPYRYMEKMSDPRVQEWIKSQAEYARRQLDAIAGRDALAERIRELDESAPYRIGLSERRANGDLYYFKRLASENLDKFYIREAASGRERLLIDPERLSEPGKKAHCSLSFCKPSPDGKYVAYGVAMSGSEQTVLHVLDVQAGKDIDAVIDRMESEYMAPCWLPDSSGFVYSRRRKLPENSPATEVYKLSIAYVHKLGSDVGRDVEIFSKAASAGVPMADADFPSVCIVPGTRHAIGMIKHGDAPELTLYSTPIDSLGNGTVSWKKICDAADEVKTFSVHGDDIYLLTSAGTPRYRVVRTSMSQPDFANAQVIVPQGQAVIDGMCVSRDALYVVFLDGGPHKTARVPFGAAPRVEMIDPPAGWTSASPVMADMDHDGVMLGVRSWTRGSLIFNFDPATRKLTESDIQPKGKFDNVPGFEAVEVMVASHDGVRVPLSILYKSGIKLDGSHPTLVNGYGAYGFSTSPHFVPANLAWLERGGVLAYAHVRGGGEYGKEWHLAGRMATKPNTWKDFIACCEYLVQQGYTSPARLAGQGGSAGGILIGRAVTSRPDLFAAALIKVGCTDALRMETTTNGVPNIAEFGSVKTLAGFQSLLEMSSYHHIVDGVRYPAVMLIHGINDPRVEPWMSAKMTARLQAASVSGKPVLFRVDYDAGHGIGSTKRQRQEQLADEWAFLLSQMGMKIQ